MGVVVRCLSTTLVGGVVWAAQAGAQATTGTISGRVVDSTSQQPLAGVTVRISGTQRGALTQADGAFILPGVPSGRSRSRRTASATRRSSSRWS
jgi:iron complex outermembrane receptor protein